MLFISYASEDREIVQGIARKLQDWRLDVWMDTNGLVVGEQWSEELARAIVDSDFFLLFVTQNSVKSDSVRREVDIAHKHKKERTILPIMLEDIKIPLGWDFQLAGIQRIRKYEDDDWFTRLLWVIRGSQPDQDQAPGKTDASNQKNQTAVTNYSAVEKTNTSPAERPIQEDEQKSDAGPPDSVLTPSELVEIFGRDFVTSSECGSVSSSLRHLAKTLSLREDDLYLEFSLEEKIQALADEVDRFTPICKAATPESNSKRRAILSKLENLIEELHD